MEPTNVADDTGVRVMQAQCSTCIFRPGNLMQLQEGRVEQMVSECLEMQGVIPCHKTLQGDVQAICRGFFDRYAREIWMLRLAIAMNAIIEITKGELQDD